MVKDEWTCGTGDKIEDEEELKACKNVRCEHLLYGGVRYKLLSIAQSDPDWGEK